MASTTGDDCIKLMKSVSEGQIPYMCALLCGSWTLNRYIKSRMYIRHESRRETGGQRGWMRKGE